MNEIFKNALPVLYEIEKAGFEAYFVGGSVRDLLMDGDIADVDIAVSATPQEIKRIFPKTIDVGIEHGTVVVLYQGQAYEVTTFRTESAYADFRRPDHVSFVRSLEEDLNRRDFTMNAIAMDKNGVIIDPFGGRKDISRKIIRTVGSPRERFQEDALRMMRAVRFVSQLSFTIEASTYRALGEYGHLLEKIAIERIAMEFDKLLLGKNHQSAMKVLIQTGLYSYLPGFRGKKNGLNEYSQREIADDITLEERWVLLLFYLPLEGEVEPMLRNWKMSVKQIKRIKKGLEWLRHRLQKDWTNLDLYSASEEIAVSTERLFNIIKGHEDTQSLERIQEQLNSLPIKNQKEMQVSGIDLMNWYNQNGGPWVKEVLQRIEKGIIFGRVQNSKEAIKEWLFKCNQM